MSASPSKLDEMLAEAGLAGDATLGGYLRALRDHDRQAPPPHGELARLLTGEHLRGAAALPDAAVPAATTVVRPLRRRVLAAGGALALAAVAATGVAAAANELPPGAQRLVSRLGERLLPVMFPLPHASLRAGTTDPDTQRSAAAAPGAAGPRPGADRWSHRWDAGRAAAGAPDASAGGVSAGPGSPVAHGDRSQGTRESDAGDRESVGTVSEDRERSGADDGQRTDGDRDGGSLGDDGGNTVDGGSTGDDSSTADRTSGDDGGASGTDDGGGDSPDDSGSSDGGSSEGWSDDGP